MLTKELESGKKICVLYHTNCADGFGAAWSFWLCFRDKATYIPVQYGQPMPQIDDGSLVYILDFSYDRQSLIELSQRCTLQVIDHHATAEKELEGLSFARFSKDFSGAYLAHLYAQPDPVPAKILYIQDRDLWQWKLPKSHEFSAALASYPFDFEVWSSLGSEQLIREGEHILRAQEQQVQRLCKNAFNFIYEGSLYPLVNTPVLQSEVCDALIKKGSPMAACFYDEPSGLRVWSLRSNDTIDVSEIAAKFGGGGRKRTAGFTTHSHYTLQLVYNTLKS